ncbi:DUF2188 domain-containing protein [Arthrobacter sp. ISL-95]|nr:DUF2188 domain-containing protein [Arthrobacter sp. ISL-95]
MMAKPSVETYYEEGQWRSRRQGTDTPFAVGGSRAEQQQRGRQAAQRDGVEHIIKNPDGVIVQRNSYQHEPLPPQNTR